MPTLKNLTCKVKWNGESSIFLTQSVPCSLEVDTKQPLEEFGERYLDGKVDCYIAVPESQPGFYTQLTSDGYIAPGLAMFVCKYCFDHPLP